MGSPSAHPLILLQLRYFTVSYAAIRAVAIRINLCHSGHVFITILSQGIDRSSRRFNVGYHCFTGPSKEGRGAGRARRGERAIVGSKKRVRVPNFGHPEIVAQIGQRTANIGISTGYVDNLRQNQLFVVDI
jgi:hypothetical protein